MKININLPLSKRKIIIITTSVILAGLITWYQFNYYNSYKNNMVPVIAAKTDIKQYELMKADKLTSIMVPNYVAQGNATVEDLKGAYARMDINKGAIIYKTMLSKNTANIKDKSIINIKTKIENLGGKIIPNDEVKLLFIPSKDDKDKELLKTYGFTDYLKPNTVCTAIIVDAVNARNESIFKNTNNNQYSDPVPAVVTLAVNVDDESKIKTLETLGTLVLVGKGQ